ncbi:MAG: hypothetical protein E7562_03470 [Ruminococcaceae bacterium]|nr:hypothetical protein [Oscillospiraceae bacterium]
MKIIKKLSIILSFVFILLMLTIPHYGKTGAINAIMLCGQVIIPALFPFTVCALYLLKCDFGVFFKKIFPKKGEIIFVFLLSMLGGYPVGAKLINEIYDKKIIDKNDSQKLICCCVNAGPAFIVIAVGNGILHSKSLGYILLSAHILSSVLISLLIIPFINTKQNKIKKYCEQPFVTSVAEASQSMISICAFVIFFSSFNSYLSVWAEKFPIIKDFSSLTEVTSGIASQSSIYKTAFLLGFAGFSVWFQIFSASKNIGINLKYFILFRIVHSTLSVLLTKLLILIFNPKVSTITNNIIFTSKTNYSTIAVSVSLLIMLILLFLTIFKKNQGRKIYDDLI